MTAHFEKKIYITFTRLVLGEGRGQWLKLGCHLIMSKQEEFNMSKHYSVPKKLFHGVQLCL